MLKLEIIVFKLYAQIAVVISCNLYQQSYCKPLCHLELSCAFRTNTGTSGKRVKRKCEFIPLLL